MQKFKHEDAKKAQKVKFNFWILPTIAIMLLIFIHSAMPADLSTVESSRLAEWAACILHIGIDPATILVRKTAHFTEYFVLGLFLSLFWKRTEIIRNRIFFRGFLSWLIGTVYAVSDEVHQYFVPGRSCEVRDICIDSAGVLVGALIVFLIRRSASSDAVGK